MNILNQIFGKLTAIQYSHTNNGRAYWDCKCECGNTKKVAVQHLKNGRTISCGCAAQNNYKKAIKIITKHGHAGTNKQTPTYHTWSAMRKRCNNPNHKGYPYYGGRGITICKEWDSFEQFLNDMGEKPEGLTLERIDPNKDYNPENCKWATRTEQNRNTRTTKLDLTTANIIRNSSDSAKVLALKYGVSTSFIYQIKRNEKWA